MGEIEEEKRQEIGQYRRTLFAEALRNLIPNMNGTSRYCEKANDSEHTFDSRELTTYIRKSHETLLQAICFNTLFRIQTLLHPSQQLQATTSKTHFFPILPFSQPLHFLQTFTTIQLTPSYSSLPTPITNYINNFPSHTFYYAIRPKLKVISNCNFIG